MERYCRFPSARASVSFRSALMGLILVLLAIPTTLAYDRTATAQKDVKKLIREAKKHTRAGLYAQSETVLRQAIEIDPSKNEALVELAFVLTKQRKIVEAYEVVVPLVKANPKDSRALAVLGATFLSAGRFKEARQVFFESIRQNKREALAWAGYGMVDFYENQISESLANLREATFHAPDEPDYLFAFAQVCTRAELYDEAAEAYQKFLRIAKVADSDRRARIRGLISFLKVLGVSGTLYRTFGTDETAVSFDLENNRPVIQLKLNGNSDPLRFVLDTGSGISVISEKTAKKLKINPVARGGTAKGIGGDGKFEIVYGLVRQIEIGDISIRNVPVYIRKFHSTSRPVDGYIGLSLISKFLTTIDYSDKSFHLTRKEDAKRAFREDNELSIPLRLTSSGFLSGEIQLPGIDVPLNFIVDTGASISVISDEVAQHDSVSVFENKEKLKVIGSAGVTDEVPSFMLPKVSFGQHTSTDIMAVALDLGIINEASGFDQAGILGGNFLKNYRLTFDFKRSRVTFVSVVDKKE